MSSATEVAAPITATTTTTNVSVSEQEVSSQAVAGPKNKIFVGNLSFRTKESDLAKFLEEAGVNVLNVNIITWRDRSMGYGFVTLENEDQAKKVVETMNKREFDGRNINLEVADENRRGTGQRHTRGHPRRFNSRRNHANASGEEGATEQRTFRPREPRQGEPSETSMFVGNLPWSMDEQGLKAIFSDYAISDVRIIRRRNNTSKGFGFIEFASHADQQRALEQKKDLEVDGRKLSIRVAVGRAAAAEEEAEEN